MVKKNYSWIFVSEVTQATEIEEAREEKRTTTSVPRILEKLEIARPSINTVPCLFSISQCSINKSKETEIVNALGKVVLHNKDVCLWALQHTEAVIGNGEGHSMGRITRFLDGGIASNCKGSSVSYQYAIPKHVGTSQRLNFISFQIHPLFPPLKVISCHHFRSISDI